MRLNLRLSSAFAAQTHSAQPVPVAALPPQGAHVQPVSATFAPAVKPPDIPSLQPSPHPAAAPGTELYTARRGESIPAVARQYLKRTAYLTSSELSEAIR